MTQPIGTLCNRSFLYFVSTRLGTTIAPASGLKLIGVFNHYCRHRFMIVLCLLSLIQAGVAFHGAIEGRVTDIKNRPLTGAQVWLDGLSVGTATDTAGRYYLELPMHGKFEVIYQFIGYKSETLTVTVSHGQRLQRNVQLIQTSIPVPTVEAHAHREVVHQSKTPEPAVVIPQTAAERAGKSTIGEAATLESGIQLQKRCSACEASELSIQGLPGRFSLILLEGTPVFSNLASRYILDILPVDFIDRLEVLKGASGAIWGSDAIAGAVNILLLQPVQPIEAKATYTRRSYGNDLSAFLGTNQKPWSLSVVGAHSNRDFVDLNRDTIAENSAFRRSILLTNFYYFPGLNWRLNTGGSFADELRRSGAIVPDSVYHTTPQAEKVNTRRWDFWHRTSLTANEKELQLRLAASEHQETGIVEQRDYTAQQTTLYTELSGSLSHLNSGVSFSRQMLTDSRLFDQGYVENNLGIWAAGKNISAVFLHTPTEILPALRMDLNSEYGTIFSPYGAVNIYPGFLDLNFAIGTGFRTPMLIFESMENLPNGYQYAIRRDPNLTRESGYSLELGATKRITTQSVITDLRLNLFHHRVSNLITAELVGTDSVTRRALFYYHNLNTAALSTGTELSISLFLLPDITTTISAYLLSPRTGSNQILPFVRRWATNYSATYKIPRWQLELNLTGELNGPMLVQTVYENNSIQSHDSPIYSVLNLRLTKQLGVIRLSGGINNLWDYHQPPSSHNEGSTDYYWGPIIGREFYGTVAIDI